MRHRTPAAQLDVCRSGDLPGASKAAIIAMRRPVHSFRPRRFVPRTPGGKVGQGMAFTRSKLGQFIRTRRVAKGLSQRSVAGMIGGKWTQGRVSALERGRFQRLREPDLTRMARILHVRPARLERLMPPPTPLLPPLTPLAKLIRSRRDALGMSRQELARRTGITDQYVGSLERRTPYVKYKTAIRLAKALHLKLSVLAPFTWPSDSPPGSALGALVQRRRRDLGLSAQALAARIGADKPAVLAIERGTVNLLNRRTEGRIARLAEALGLDAAELEAVRPPVPSTGAEPAGTLGGDLTRHRLARRWTQVDLAERAGIGAAALCFIEGNKQRPSDATLVRLAQALDISLERLRRLRRLLPPQERSAPAPPQPGSRVHARRRELERLAVQGASLEDIGAHFGVSNVRASQMLRSLGLREQWAAVRREMRTRRRAEATRTWIGQQISPDLLARIEAQAGPVEAFSRSACRVNGFRVLIHRCTRPHKAGRGTSYWKWEISRPAARYLLAAPDGHMLVLPRAAVRRLPGHISVRSDWERPKAAQRQGPDVLVFKDRWDLLHARDRRDTPRRASGRRRSDV